MSLTTANPAEVTGIDCSPPPRHGRLYPTRV